MLFKTDTDVSQVESSIESSR